MQTKPERPAGGYAGYEFVAQIMAMNQMYGQPVNDKPYLPVDAATRLQNFKKILLDEVNEVDEIINAIRRDDGVPSEVLLTSIADWLGDTIVYCTSEMIKYGLPPLAVLQIIMASNFSKLSEDGKPILDETGQKFLKGPNYWKPEGLIEELIVDLSEPTLDDLS